LNPVVDQTIRVTCDGQVVDDLQVENRDSFLNPVDLQLVSNLPPGEHQIRLQFGKTVKEQCGTRDLAMMFLQLDLQASSSLSQHSSDDRMVAVA